MTAIPPQLGDAEITLRRLVRVLAAEAARAWHRTACIAENTSSAFPSVPAAICVTGTSSSL